MNTSILLEAHTANGARLAMGPTGETLLTFGNVPGEYQSATTTALVLDQTDRGLVRVSGKDATDFLHRITANHIKGLKPGCGNLNLLLTGKGKIVEMFDLLRLEGQAGYLLSTPPGRAVQLVAALDMYLFSEDVTLIDQTSGYAPLAMIGPQASELAEYALAALGFTGATGRLSELENHAAIELENNAATGPKALRAIAMPIAGQAGLRLEPLATDGDPHTIKDFTHSLWEALCKAGARPGGLALFDILRTEACVAAFGVEIDDTIYPQEARLEHAFSLEKGCYIGQEVVAKIDTYGGLNKRLFALQTQAQPIPRGIRLWREDPERGWRDLGVITSWAWSFSLDTGLALAYIKRRHQEAGTVFHLANADANPATIASAPIATLIETPLAPAASPA